jgi:hypothetical protein
MNKTMKTEDLDCLILPIHTCFDDRKETNDDADGTGYSTAGSNPSFPVPFSLFPPSFVCWLLMDEMMLLDGMPPILYVGQGKNPNRTNAIPRIDVNAWVWNIKESSIMAPKIRIPRISTSMSAH